MAHPFFINMLTALKGSQFYPKLYNMAHLLAFNVVLLPKDLTIILFAITAAGVVPCGGPKKSPRTSTIVQIIFFF